MPVTMDKFVDDLWGQVVSALGGFGVAAIGAVGLWWRGSADRSVKQLETSGAVEVAQINADSSERIHVIDVLSSRVAALENHNATQDERIAELVHRNATLEATNTLLAEQNGLLRRQVRMLEQENVSLAKEVDLLREAVQGPISDALELLDGENS